ncbi:hypothetical protein V6N13_085851 [Hibiscus sabdariffa]|uniref:Uncharacterized protein n=1 Tax=Hibiscus sabdariffa TaxID=183260 RepID=A0ABR2FS39_9ROSI
MYNKGRQQIFRLQACNVRLCTRNANHGLIKGKANEVWEGIFNANGARMAGSILGLQQTENNVERHLNIQTAEQATIDNGNGGNNNT